VASPVAVFQAAIDAGKINVHDKILIENQRKRIYRKHI